MRLKELFPTSLGCRVSRAHIDYRYLDTIERTVVQDSGIKLF